MTDMEGRYSGHPKLDQKIYRLLKMENLAIRRWSYNFPCYNMTKSICKVLHPAILPTKSSHET